MPRTLTLHFEPSLERQYRLAMRADQRRATFVCVTVAFAIWITFFGLDLLRLDKAGQLPPYGDHGLMSALVLRIGVLTLMIWLQWRLATGDASFAYHRISGCLIAAIGIAGAYIASTYKARGLPHADIAQIVIVVAVFLPIGLTIVQATAVAALVAFATAMLGFVMTDPSFWAEHARLCVVMLCAILVSGVGGWLRERAERDHFLLRRILHDRALSDPLTGIANRRAFEEHVALALRQARRDGVPVVFAVLDVDHFKRYNDRYGHELGDRALRKVARAIESCLRRPMDMVGRIGGEEFGLLLYECCPDVAESYFETIVAAVETLAIPHEASPTAGQLTATLGGTAFDGREEAAELYSRADAVLYRAKADGRNRSRFEESAEWEPGTPRAMLPG